LAVKPFTAHDESPTPLHSMPPLEGPRRNIAMTFGTEKLEWFGSPIVKEC